MNYVLLRVECQLLLSYWTKLEFSRQVFEKLSKAIFHENSSSGAEFFHADGQTDRQTDIMKNLSAFRNFAIRA